MLGAVPLPPPRRGDILPATVTHLEKFGAFVDIGCGIPSLLPIDTISVSRISHPRDRFVIGQKIRAVVRQTEPHRIHLTHRELLGTWEENAAAFSAGQTVAGIIRSVESYGVFVELAPNLAGLAEPLRRCCCRTVCQRLYQGDPAGKMKVKLILIDTFAQTDPPQPPRYFVPESQTHLDYWRYTPDSSPRIIETDFRFPNSI